MNNNTADDNIPTLTQVIHPGDESMQNHFDAHYFDKRPEAEVEIEAEAATEAEPIPEVEIEAEATSEVVSISDVEIAAEVETIPEAKAESVAELNQPTADEQNAQPEEKQEPFIGENIEDIAADEVIDTYIAQSENENSHFQIDIPLVFQQEELIKTIDLIVYDAIAKIMPEIEQKLSQQIRQQIHQKIFDQDTDN